MRSHAELQEARKGDSSKWMASLLAACRVLLGSVLLLSGLVKLGHPYDFLGNVYAYRLVGVEVGLLVASIVPWLEVTLGLCLVGGIAVSGAFLLSALMLALFVLAQATVLYRGLRISCGCLVSDGELVGVMSLSRALGLGIMAGVAYYACICQSLVPTSFKET